MGASFELKTDRRLKDKIRTQVSGQGKLAWYIKFNDDLANETVNAKNIIITDCFNNRVSADIIHDAENRTIKIIPQSKIKEDMTYTLTINQNLASNAGGTVRQPLCVHFTMKSGGNIDTPIDEGPIPHREESSSSSKRPLIAFLLFLLLAIPLAVILAGNLGGDQQDFNDVLAAYNWNIRITGRYNGQNNEAYYLFQELRFKNNEYKLYLVNETGVESTDVKIEVFDSLNELVGAYIVPKSVISELETKVHLFNIDFEKKKISRVNKNLSTDLDGNYNFDSL